MKSTSFLPFKVLRLENSTFLRSEKLLILMDGHLSYPFSNLEFCNFQVRKTSFSYLVIWVVLPNQVRKQSISRLENWTFLGLEKVLIPMGIRRIGKWPFSNLGVIVTFPTHFPTWNSRLFRLEKCDFPTLEFELFFLCYFEIRKCKTLYVYTLNYWENASFLFTLFW